MTTPEPFLVAHVCSNRTVFDVAYCNEDGDWATINGWQVWPFWYCQLTDCLYTTSRSPRPHHLCVNDFQPPPGWSDHLQTLADQYAAQHRAMIESRRKIDISALAKPFTMTRRV